MMRRIATSAASLVVCSFGASACAAGTAHPRYVSRAAPHGRVQLVPVLDGGEAGWCMATETATATEGSATCVEPATSTGPIFAESCDPKDTAVDVYAITKTEVASVSVDGAAPVRTVADPTLPSGRRWVAVEVLRRKGRPASCLHLTALGRNGKPIRVRGASGAPLAVKFAAARSWQQSAPPPGGACKLTVNAPQNPRSPWVGAAAQASSGEIATQVRPVPRLLTPGFLSCAHAVYYYREENALNTAVLLDASHPGSTPPKLPGMKRLPGRPGIYEAPGAEGRRVARRVRGAWLIVEEADGLGLQVPADLLEQLHATIRL
jgi:hypothetical protein